MRRPLSGSMIFALMAVPALAQARKSQPVGLVLSPGASIVRAAVTAPVKPGEVIFAGDTLKSGASGVSFLFCPEKFSATLPAGAEALFQDCALHVKSGTLAGKKAVAACFLPEVQKLSIASQQHYGAMVTRAGSQPPPTTTFDQRVGSLTAEKRKQLQSELASTQASDPAFQVVRAAALERAGLWYDAGEAYRQAADQFIEMPWIQRKITEMENMLLKEQSR